MLSIHSLVHRTAIKAALRICGPHVRTSRMPFSILQLPTMASSSSIPLPGADASSFVPLFRGFQSTSICNNESPPSSSHDDFAPKRKAAAPEGADAAVAMIAEHVKNNPVMLYMKGNPSQPMCGFSAKVVGILQKEGIDFSSVNVLDYPSIREGVKQFSQWPTIPQLYVNAEFIGGCDIVTAMHESGELAELLQSAAPKSAESTTN